MAVPNCVFFDGALLLISAPIRCIEAILYAELFFHVSLLKFIKALSTTFAPKEWAIILILLFGYFVLKSEINFASLGPFCFAINLAIFQPDGFIVVFESQLKPTTGI